MTRRLWSMVLSVLLLVVPATVAWSSVSGKSYEVQGTMKMKAKMKGLPKFVEHSVFTDRFDFFEDGSFSMIDVEGNWDQVNKRFTVELDEIDIETGMEEVMEEFMEEVMEDEQVVPDVTILKSQFKGKEKSKDGTIKGTIKWKARIEVHTVEGMLLARGKFLFKFSFVGMPTGAAAQAGRGFEGSSLLGVLGDGLVRAVEGIYTAPLR